MTTIEKKAVSIREFAIIMDISPAHAWRLINSSEVQSFRLGRRHCIPITVVNKMLGVDSNEDKLQPSA